MKRVEAKTAGVAGALGHFGVSPKAVPRVLELAGLGALAVPVVHHMAKADNTTDRTMSGVELGGLGLLAAPEVMHLLRR